MPKKTDKEPRRINFTKRALEAVQVPKEGEVTLYDTKQHGLAFRIRTSGARAFYLIRKWQGRVHRLKLGDFPATSIEQGRKRARKEINDQDNGIDISAKRRAERGEMTLKRLWDTYHDEHLEPRCTAKTCRAETYLFNKWLADLNSRRLSDISPANIKQRHAKIGKSGETSANRAVQLLRRLYRYAQKHHGYEGRIPTTAVELFPERSRERFLSADELPKFLKACDAEGQPWADFFRLSLFTGARRSNVLSMRWAHLDLTAKTWTIPSDESKSGRQMTLPLTQPAVDILLRRKEDWADDQHEYVFPPIRNKGKSKHLTAPARRYDAILERAGLENVTIHDLRRTAGAWMAASGASLPMIGKALGHNDLRATQIYSRLDLSPVRDVMENAAAAMNGDTNDSDKD